MKAVLTNIGGINPFMIKLLIYLHIYIRCIVILEFNVSGSPHKSNIFLGIFIDTSSVVMQTAFLGFPTISIPDFVRVPYAPSWTRFSYLFYNHYCCWWCCRREIHPKVKTGSAVTSRKFTERQVPNYVKHFLLFPGGHVFSLQYHHTLCSF